MSFKKGDFLKLAKDMDLELGDRMLVKLKANHIVIFEETKTSLTGDTMVMTKNKHYCIVNGLPNMLLFGFYDNELTGF